MEYVLHATFIKILVAYDQIITLTMTEFFYISIKKNTVLTTNHKAACELAIPKV